MTVILPHVSREGAAINALLVQVDGTCKLSCSGCYFKKWEANHATSDVSHVRAVCQSLVDGTLALNQLTLSFNSWEAVKQIMQEPLLVPAIQKVKKSGGEVHATIFSVQLLLKAGQAAHDFLSHLSVLTVSTSFGVALEHLKELREKHPRLRLMLNYQPAYEPKKDGEAYIAFVEGIADVFDKVHLLINKPGPKARVEQVEMVRFVEAKQALRGSSLRAKIIVDNCYTDSYRSLSSGKTCSAGISKFHLWPGGTVSGCPYNPSPQGTSAEKVTTMVFHNNLFEAFGYDEMALCRIPDSVDKKGLPILQ